MQSLDAELKWMAFIHARKCSIIFNELEKLTSVHVIFGLLLLVLHGMFMCMIYMYVCF